MELPEEPAARRYDAGHDGRNGLAIPVRHPGRGLTMSILTQLYLYPQHRSDDESRAFGLRLAAFHRALNNELEQAKVRAPFVKVAPSVASHEREPNAFVYQGIAHVEVVADPLPLLASDAHAGRRLAAEWAASGLAAVATKTGWDAAPVLEIIAATGAHEGPYRDVRDRLAAVDRAGLRWVPLFEWDEGGAAFLVEAHDQNGRVVERVTLVTDEKPWLVDYTSVKARRTADAVEYVVGEDQILGRLPLDGPVVAPAEPPAIELGAADIIPTASKPAPGDMRADEFWGLIDRLDWSRGNHEDVLEPLILALAERSRTERRAFDNTLARLLYDLDGRAWARRMGLGWHGDPDDLSTDTFVYARCAVVVHGRAYYDEVRQDPAQMRPDEDFEAILYAASEAHQRRTGDEDDFEARLSYETFSNSAGWD